MQISKHVPSRHRLSVFNTLIFVRGRTVDWGGGGQFLKINILAVKHLKINIMAWVPRKINK